MDMKYDLLKDKKKLISIIATSGQEQQKKRTWLSYCPRLLLGMEMTAEMGEKILSPFNFSVSDWLKSPSFNILHNQLALTNACDIQ